MSKTVLVIEDEPLLQDVYHVILSSKGYQVHSAANGIEGISALKTICPDLILLDLYMPVMDGREFLRNIDLNHHKKTSVIVYSNLSDKKTEHEMIELGARAFVLKSSMGPRDLLQLVEDTIGTP